MKFLILFIICFYMPFVLNSQIDIHKYYKYDTTITSVNIPLDLANFSPKDYNINVCDSFLYIYSVNYKEDTLKFFSINLNSKIIDSILLVHKKISDKIKTPFLRFFSINKKFIVIYSSYYNLIVYDRLNYNKVIIDTSFEYCNFMNCRLIDDDIYLYINYNNHPNMCVKNTKFSVMSIAKNKFIYDTIIYNPFIEFTHFSPNNFVTIHPKGLFFWSNSAQPLIYSLSDKFQLEKYPIKLDTTCLMNLNYLKGFYKVKKEYDPKSVIDFLSPFEDSVSRVEQINFVNDSIFHLVKIPCDNKIKNRLRYHDFYKYKLNKMIPIEIDVIEKKMADDIIYTKLNFPLLSSETMMSKKIFSDQYYIILRPMSKTPLLGKSKKEHDKILEKEDPNNFVYGITIFKLDSSQHFK